MKKKSFQQYKSKLYTYNIKYKMLTLLYWRRSVLKPEAIHHCFESRYTTRNYIYQWVMPAYKTVNGYKWVGSRWWCLKKQQKVLCDHGDDKSTFISRSFSIPNSLLPTYLNTYSYTLTVYINIQIWKWCGVKALIVKKKKQKII